MCEARENMIKFFEATQWLVKKRQSEWNKRTHKSKNKRAPVDKGGSYKMYIRALELQFEACILDDTIPKRGSK